MEALGKAEREWRKPLILRELKTGTKREFYKECLRNDYAFDIEAGGVKYEFGPCRRSYYLGGAEATYDHAENCYCYPEFDWDELSELLDS